MNEKLPYEEQLAEKWGELSLPEEDIAWSDMERRLRKKDDDDIVPFWLTGCALWGIIAVLLVAIGWWIIRPEKWFFKKNNATPTETRKDLTETNRPHADSSIGLQQKMRSLNSEIEKGDSNDRLTKTSLTNKNESKEKIVRRIENDHHSEKSMEDNHQRLVKETLIGKGQNKKTISRKLQNSKIDEPYANATNAINDTRNHQIDSSKKIELSTNVPFSQSAPQNVVTARDTAETNGALQKATATPEQKNSKKISFAAGLSLQQQLPINGQKLTPYNSSGRKGTLADYIPSVYARVYKQDKWFVQPEFRYGAPQYTKQFVYKQQLSIDTMRSVLSTTSNLLKKTFYHQLPITFNYFVMPRWSIGGGITWNKFVSAVSQQDIVQHNYILGTDSAISKGVIVNTEKADSNFVNSYFQAILETEYKWKRFSIGIRYSFGLEPYIKFRLPGGNTQEEKSSSINLLLRYELWRSGRSNPAK